MFSSKLKKENQELRGKIAKLEKQRGETFKILGKYFARISALDVKQDVRDKYLELTAEIMALAVFDHDSAD